MKYTIKLDRNEDTRAVEEQEQARFIKTILEAIEVPIQFDPDRPLSIDERITFNKSLRTYNINIINDGDGTVKIYVERELVAEFFKCKYILKQDLKQIDPKKRLYLDMTVEFNSEFEKPKEEVAK